MLGLAEMVLGKRLAEQEEPTKQDNLEYRADDEGQVSRPNPVGRAAGPMGGKLKIGRDTKQPYPADGQGHAQEQQVETGNKARHD